MRAFVGLAAKPEAHLLDAVAYTAKGKIKALAILGSVKRLVEAKVHFADPKVFETTYVFPETLLPELDGVLVVAVVRKGFLSRDLTWYHQRDAVQCHPRLKDVDFDSVLLDGQSQTVRALCAFETTQQRVCLHAKRGRVGIVDRQVRRKTRRNHACSALVQRCNSEPFERRSGQDLKFHVGQNLGERFHELLQYDVLGGLDDHLLFVAVGQLSALGIWATTATTAATTAAAIGAHGFFLVLDSMFVRLFFR